MRETAAGYRAQRFQAAIGVEDVVLGVVGREGPAGVRRALGGAGRAFFKTRAGRGIQMFQRLA